MTKFTNSAQPEAKYGRSGRLKAVMAFLPRGPVYISLKVGVPVLAALALFAASMGMAPDSAIAKSKAKKTKRTLVVVISLDRQRLKVYDGEDVVRSAPVSSGKSGHRTPKGIFSILQKNREHYSNLYNDAPMPYMQRLTWSGIALHHGKLPGYAASHGCVRLGYSFSQGLFDITSRGTRVIVSQDGASPEFISHRALFRPLAPLESLVSQKAPQPVLNEKSTAQVAIQSNKIVKSANKTVTPVPTPVLIADRGNQVTLSSSSSAAQLRQVAMIDPTSRVSPSAAPPTAALFAPAATPSVPAAQIGDSAVPRLNRAQLKEARKARLVALKETITTAKMALAGFRQISKTRASSLRQAGKTATIIKSKIKKLKRLATKAVARANDAADDLSSFERQYRNRIFDAVKDAPVIEAAMVRETVLEDRYFDLSESAYLARHDTSSMNGRLPSYLKEVKAKRRALSDAKKDVRRAQGAYRAALDARKKAVWAQKRRHKPIAILISGRTKRLYIRQGFKPIYDTPIKIINPSKPLGTHVFTATDFTKDKMDLIWTVVSFEGRVYHSARARRKNDALNDYSDVLARNALARIEIPEDARYEIAQLIKPGSSLIISDRRANLETGKYTDFIVSLN